MTTFKIGQQFHYTGDQANLPGIAIIIAIKSSQFYGQTYSLRLKNSAGEMRMMNGVTDANFAKSPGRRLIPWEEYKADRAKRIAELEDFMKNKPADFHSQCVKRQVINFDHPFIQ